MVKENVEQLKLALLKKVGSMVSSINNSSNNVDPSTSLALVEQLGTLITTLNNNNNQNSTPIASITQQNISNNIHKDSVLAPVVVPVVVARGR